MDELMTWASVATAVATSVLAVAALFAYRAAMATLRTAQESNRQAQRDSIARTRPYVHAEIIPGLAGHQCYDLRITNTGRSTARNLVGDVVTWPSDLDDVGEQIRDLLTTPRSLPPGASLRVMWRLEGAFTDGTSEAGMGPQHIVKLEYSSDDPSAPRYEDQFEALTIRSGLWPMPSDGPNPQNLHGEALQFYKLGRALVRQVGELSR
ncbi:hypothetical protein UQW22_09815 [Isoptericola halotolerans]|uniref:hypothetical protein n=1 Tax=Isoptericola halotolerans TaxID=300560 RepID=UPI00388DEC9F